MNGRWHGAVKLGEYFRLNIYRLEVLQKARRMEWKAEQIVYLHAVNEVADVFLQLLRREGQVPDGHPDHTLYSTSHTNK